MIFSIFVCILSLVFAVDYKVLSYLCIHNVFFNLSLLKTNVYHIEWTFENQAHVKQFSVTAAMWIYLDLSVE